MGQLSGLTLGNLGPRGSERGESKLANCPEIIYVYVFFSLRANVLLERLNTLKKGKRLQSSLARGSCHFIFRHSPRAWVEMKLLHVVATFSFNFGHLGVAGSQIARF